MTYWWHVTFESADGLQRAEFMEFSTPYPPRMFERPILRSMPAKWLDNPDPNLAVTSRKYELYDSSIRERVVRYRELA